MLCTVCVKKCTPFNAIPARTGAIESGQEKYEQFFQRVDDTIHK